MSIGLLVSIYLTSFPCSFQAMNDSLIFFFWLTHLKKMSSGDGELMYTKNNGSVLLSLTIDNQYQNDDD